MQSITYQIQEKITTSVTALLKISPEIASNKPTYDSWSKKEILGHLIDSALNNHQRVVRAAQDQAINFPTYNQIQWVNIQGYNDMEWNDLINFFSQCNNHLCRVINVLPKEAFKNLCNVGSEKTVTLAQLIEDYFKHLTHHLEKIIG